MPMTADEMELFGGPSSARVYDPHEPDGIRRNGHSEPTFPKPIAAWQLMRDYPRMNEPLINGLVRRVEIANIVSESKLGKSWMMLNLGITCVGGGLLWGQYLTTAGKVLYIDNELHHSVIANRLEKVADAMGVRAEGKYKTDLFFEPLRGKRFDVFTLGRYLEQFEPGEFDYIILDAVYRFWPKGLSENDNAAWVEVMNTLESYAERMQAALLMVHHSTKGLQGEKRVTDVGAGGGAQSRAVDCHLVLRQHETPGVVVVDAAVRSFKPIEAFCLRWDFPLWMPAEDCDPAKLKVAKPTGKAKAEAEANDPTKMTKFERACQDALALLLKLGPSSKSKWRNAAGISSDKMNAAIEVLSERKQIEPCKVETGGGSYDGFKPVISAIPQGSEGSEGSEEPTRPGAVGKSPSSIEGDAFRPDPEAGEGEDEEESF